MKKHPLRRWRESHEETVTLKALAERLKIGQSILSEIETWKKKPSLDLACRLHAMTGIEPAAFNEGPGK